MNSIKLSHKNCEPLILTFLNQWYKYVSVITFNMSSFTKESKFTIFINESFNLSFAISNARNFNVLLNDSFRNSFAIQNHILLTFKSLAILNGMNLTLLLNNLLFSSLLVLKNSSLNFKTQFNGSISNTLFAFNGTNKTSLLIETFAFSYSFLNGTKHSSAERVFRLQSERYQHH